MASFPGDLPRSPPYPPLSSLSPLAAPFTAGGRPLPSDPIHNPASLGPTAPMMFQAPQRQRSIPAEGFAFSSGSDGVGAGVAPYYQPYEPWKWAPDVIADGSSSWMDPSQSYPVPPMDKGSAPSMAFKHYEHTQIPPSGSHRNPLPNTSCIIPEASPWKRARDHSLYSIDPLLPKGSRASAMGPTFNEPSLDPFPNASRSSVVSPTDRFSNGFRSSVVGPMLKDLSDSFSLDASSTKGYPGLPYDKYMTQLESCSSLSSTDPSPFGPGGGLGVVPTDPLVNCTSGFSSMHYGNPCRISFDYFDYLPQEQKEPASHCTTSRAKVTITAPVANPPASKGDNQVVGPRELQIKCGSGNVKPDQPGTCFDAILDSSAVEALDHQSVVLDSPCWKGMASSSQYTFSKRHNGNSCNAPLESEISTENILPAEISQDKKLDSITIGSVNSSEEKAKDGKTNRNFEGGNEEETVSSDNNLKNAEGKGLVSVMVSNSVGPQRDVKLLIESMYDLSQALLTSCVDDFELKGHEMELLQMAMENLKSFTARRNKLKTDDGGAASSSKTPEQINAGMDNQKSSNEANDIEIKVGPHLADTNYKKSVLEALDKIPGDDSEVQVELYKNLWIEAEVSLCTMKYELQLARTKLKMESQKHAQEANSSSSFCDSKPSDSIQERRATALPKQTLMNQIYDLSKEKDTEGAAADPAVMARFKLIKGRVDNMESQDQSNVEKSLGENITEQKEFSSLGVNGNEVLQDEADSDVMARLKILKQRGDVGLNAESVFPNYYSLGYAKEPQDLLLHATSSEWEHVVRDELFPSGNKSLN